MTLTVPDDDALDAVEILEEMIEEFFYANREHLGEDALGSMKFGIERLEEG